MTEMTQEQFQTKVLGGVEALQKSLEAHEQALTSPEGDVAKLKAAANASAAQLQELRRERLGRRAAAAPGQVSEGCARELAGTFILMAAASGRLEQVSASSATRDALLGEARAALGVTGKAALGTGDVPLPVQYAGELRELVSQFGVCRRKMFPYPLGLGTARLPRMGTRPAFGSVAMSGPFTEKSPGFDFASLESHKIGGIVRLPRELDEQSIVPLGQFLARYGAVEFARAEDQWGFLADGSPTYESVRGIVKVARDVSKTAALASTKTKPSDATLEDFRAVRRQVNKAVLSGRAGAYYLDTTWETRLASFRTQAEPTVYQRLPDGSALLDGYPIVWTDVLEPYGTVAAADKPIAVFGALEYWWMAEKGSPRMDTSEHVWFANDQLAVRFIEEIDFDYMANDATAVLLTAAS